MALIMFDYDGVIVDSLKFLTENFIDACNENGFYDITSQDQLLNLFDGNMYENMLTYGLDIRIVDQIINMLKIRENENIENLRLFKGIEDALNTISQKNKLFIITSNHSSTVINMLEKNKITCFEDVIGAEKEKSKIKKIKSTMSKYPNLTAYYVGDTKGDMLEGKIAGANTI